MQFHESIPLREAEYHPHPLPSPKQLSWKIFSSDILESRQYILGKRIEGTASMGKNKTNTVRQ